MRQTGFFATLVPTFIQLFQHSLINHISRGPVASQQKSSADDHAAIACLCRTGISQRQKNPLQKISASCWTAGAFDLLNPEESLRIDWPFQKPAR
jgi:hypothetical protein